MVLGLQVTAHGALMLLCKPVLQAFFMESVVALCLEKSFEGSLFFRTLPQRFQTDDTLLCHQFFHSEFMFKRLFYLWLK